MSTSSIVPSRNCIAKTQVGSCSVYRLHRHQGERKQTEIQEKLIRRAVQKYTDELDQEVNEDRSYMEKNFTPKTKSVEERQIKESTTNSESDYYVKGERENQFAHSYHTDCDRHVFVLGMIVTLVNVHDSVFFPYIRLGGVKGILKKDFFMTNNLTVIFVRIVRFSVTGRRHGMDIGSMSLILLFVRHTVSFQSVRRVLTIEKLSSVISGKKRWTKSSISDIQM